MLFLLVCSAFFSSTETAITSIGQGRLRFLVNAHERKRRALTHLLEEPNDLITALLLLNNLVNVAASSLMTLIVIQIAPALPDYQTGLLATGVMTASLLVFGEITPKNFAKHNAERVTLATINQIDAMSRVLHPIIGAFRGIARGIAHLFGHDLSRQEQVEVSDEQIETLLDAGEESGLLDAEDGEMIRRILDFDEMLAEQLMVPRTDVQAIEVGTSTSEAREIVARDGHSRFPVYEGVPDNVVGTLYAKDLLALNGDEAQTLHGVLRPVYYTPTTKPVNQLLREFQKQRVHLAVVIDEYGGMAGIVTLEDILEEIVGEIEDEYDTPAALVKRVSPHEAVVEGDIPVHDLNRMMDLELPEDEGVTVSGLILSRLGSLPSAGDKLTVENVRLAVEAATEREITSVRIVVDPVPTDEEPNGS
ncbi:MAG: HlyC/CorC family transporter [Candidatus Bipolaricaulota bacterium]|nr:MAG: HlyC/CorC family transporter [Candidatus Bipolaricaulota bacterium]